MSGLIDVQATFRLSEDDRRAFLRFETARVLKLAKANSRLFLFNLLLWVPVGVLLAILGTISQRTGQPLSGAWTVVAAVLLGYIVATASQHYQRRVVHRAVFAEDGPFFEEKEVKFSENCLSIESSSSFSSIPWTSIRHLADDGGRYYLYLDNTGPIILPKHIFPSQRETDLFREKACNSQQARQPSPSGCA